MLLDGLGEMLDVFALSLGTGLQILSKHLNLCVFFLYGMYLFICFLSVVFGLFLGCFKALIYIVKGRFELFIEELLKLQVPDLIIGPMVQLLM